LGSFKQIVTQAGLTTLAVTAIGTAAGFVADSFRTWHQRTLEVGDLADKLHTTTEEASGLREIANDLNIPLSALDMAFRGMAREGIPPTIEGLIQVKARLDETKDPAERLALAQTMLGRSGGELFKIFQLSNGELRAYVENMNAGQKVTSGQVETARKLRDKIDMVSDAWEGATLQIGHYVAKSIFELVPAMDTTNRSLEYQTRLLGEIAIANAQSSEERVQAEERLAAVNEMIAAQQVDQEGMWQRFGSVLADAGEEVDSLEGKAEDLGASIRNVPSTKWIMFSMKVDDKEIVRFAKKYGVSLSVAFHVLTGKLDMATFLTLYTGGGHESASGTTRTTDEGGGGAQQAGGGPLGMGGNSAEVGERGTEGVIRTRSGWQVIPHDQWEAMKRSGAVGRPKPMALGGEVESGGFTSSQYTADEYLRSLSYSAGAGYYLGTGGAKVTGGGSGGGYGTSGGGGGSAASVANAVAAAAGIAVQAASSAAQASAGAMATQIPVAVAQQTREQNRIMAAGQERLIRAVESLKAEIARAVRDAVATAP
jgi:hypothetical protein